VEHVGQEAFLLQRGCEFAQGYFYARPAPEHEIVRLLLEEQAAPAGDHRAAGAKR
jgi:EAL domain-containing protein (putative c-di-GMP-specific phosphodiesterase class I)